MHIVFIVVVSKPWCTQNNANFFFPSFQIVFLTTNQFALDILETLENLFIRKKNSATRGFNSIRYILDAFRRHVHLELRLITHELTVMFGIHMVMQTIVFNILVAELIKEIYNTIMSINVTSTYQAAINIFDFYIWIIINVVKMIVFNLLCEEINDKVSLRSFQNFRKCIWHDNYFPLVIDICKTCNMCWNSSRSMFVKREIML